MGFYEGEQLQAGERVLCLPVLILCRTKYFSQSEQGERIKADRIASRSMLHVSPSDTRRLNITETPCLTSRARVHSWANPSRCLKFPTTSKFLAIFTFQSHTEVRRENQGKKIPLLLALNGFEFTQKSYSS